MKNQIAKIIRKSKSLENLETANKYIDMGIMSNKITWNESKELYRLIDAMKLEIGDSENQIEMGDL